MLDKITNLQWQIMWGKPLGVSEATYIFFSIETNKGPILSMMSHKQLVVVSCSTSLVLFITVGSSLRLAVAEGGMTKSLSYVDNIQN